MLKINGNDLISKGIKAGPRLGYILGILLELVIENPEFNEKEKLLAKSQELNQKSDSELITLSEKAKEIYRDTLDESESEIKKKYYVSDSSANPHA